MGWTQRIFSTLETWAFKKKLLKFSDRFARDPLACFYCPEMCRFACPVAETLKHSGVTPRGKMSLLHMEERGISTIKVSGSTEVQNWFLDQCTGCGRCTEYCVHEVDVASNIRRARQRHISAMARGCPVKPTAAKILLAEPGRKSWWESQPQLLARLDVQEIWEWTGNSHHLWSRGILSSESREEIAEHFSKVKNLWVESPEVAWFFARGLQNEEKKIYGKIRTVWQEFFCESLKIDLDGTQVFHESYHLSRLLPREGYSIPMYEKGSMPFHHGWNVWDCGGEGHYHEVYPQEAIRMGQRFIADLTKDGRTLAHIVCQSLCCTSHLQKVVDSLNQRIKVSYWLDHIYG